MKFKFMGIVVALIVFPLLLSGCVYGNLTVDIKENGSGKVKLVGGFSKEILNKIGKTPKDVLSQSVEYYELTSGGKKYLATTWEDAFLVSEDINTTSVGTLSSELGPVQLVKTNSGFQLNLGLWDFLNPDMKPKHILPELKNLTEESLEGMTLADLIAQNADGLNLKVTFNMPYEVKQVKGGTDGVVVKGKKISLDYLKMIKSGSRDWSFESLNPKVDMNRPLFSDVSNSDWYANAVKAAYDAKVMVGFNGAFKPNNPLNLSELTKIVAAGLGYDIPNNPVYWAMGHVLFAQENEFVLSKAEPTAKNWEVPATREQVVYAITLATNNRPATGNVKAEDIKGWENIDPKMQSTILAAYNAGIVKGDANGSFNAKGKITRAEMAQILYNIKWTVPEK